jgi:uncharacterized phage infection (PIP) family protein YhgE
MKEEYTLKYKWKKALKNPYWWLLIIGYIALVETLYLLTK